jgi:dynein regulatory complex subunit 2
MKFGKQVKGTAGVGSLTASSGNGEAQLRDKLQREAEMELKRQYAMKARRRLKSELEREATFSSTNRLMIQNQWRKIMRLAKVESLRKEIEIMSQNHERDVDRKDAVIQMLDRDLEEAEEQYQMALRSHLQNIDALIDLQDSRLLALENEFEKDLQTLEDEFEAERSEMIQQQKSESDQLKDIMTAVDADEKERETDSKHEHEQLREEIRNKNLEDINVLRITLESQIEDLEKHFEHAHLNYLQNTDQRTQDFKYLTTQDRTLSKEIEIKILKIERLQQSQQHWRSKIASNKRECNARNKALKTERDAIAGHYKSLKDRMNKFRDLELNRLTHLTKTAHWCKDELNIKLKVAKQILSTAQLTQTMETEKEKVLPFDTAVPMSSLMDEERRRYEQKDKQDDLKTVQEKKELNELMSACGPSKAVCGADPIAINSDVQAVGYREPINEDIATRLNNDDLRNFKMTGIEEWDYLERFNLKFNNVLMDKLMIEKRRNSLKQENKDLQGVLQQFLGT